MDEGPATIWERRSGQRPEEGGRPHQRSNGAGHPLTMRRGVRQRVDGDTQAGWRAWKMGDSGCLAATGWDLAPHHIRTRPREIDPAILRMNSDFFFSIRSCKP